MMILSRRQGGLALAVFFSAATFVVRAAAHDEPVDARAVDQRIAYYSARLGGPATYPAFARLGLALLDKARDTGDWTHWREAMTHLRTSLNYQHNYEALLGLALGHAAVHQFPEALRHAEDAVRAAPDSVPALGALFDIQLALGNATEAATILTRLQKLDPGFASMSRESALCEYRGERAAAIIAMRRTTNSLDREHTAPLQAWAQVRLGSLHLANCDAPSARDCYERALKILPGCFVAGEKLAEWHAANSRWNEARRGFEQLLEQRPEPACRLGLAEAARQLGDNPSARREEQKVIRELRERARRGQEDQLRPLALLLVEEEVGAERAEGLRWARRDAELRQDIFTIDTLAWAHWRNGNTNEAVTLSRKALRAGNRSPLLLLHSGLIHVGTGNAGRGRALLKEATSCPTGFGLHERRLLPAAQAEQSAPPP